VNPAKGDNLRKLAQFFQVPVSYLLGESGDAPAMSAPHKGTILSEIKGMYEAIEKLPVGQAAPLISFASAGNAKAYEDQGYNVERIPTGCRDPHCYALEVEGDSMEPKYSRGDIIFVAPTQEARNGDLVVAKTKQGDVCFKLYHWSQHKADPVKLTSFNQAYPVIAEPRGEFEFIHPVHSVLRRLRKDL
jgi:phage repressor protein C with HTH and peptisase S24 domain